MQSVARGVLVTDRTRFARTHELGSHVMDEAEVKRRIDDLAPGGGFIFTPVHNVQADVPPENYLAMWETWEEYGKY
jgi:uroporphyrinogen-III decarboxylase